MSVLLSIDKAIKFTIYSLSLSYFQLITLITTHFRYAVSGTLSRTGWSCAWPRFSRIRARRPASAAAAAQHLQKLAFADVEGARAGDQDAAGPQHLQGAEVQLFVAAQGGGHGAPGLGEGGRIEHDGVVLPAGGGVVLEQVEGVGLDPFDLAATMRGAIELLVSLGDLERRTRRVNRRSRCRRRAPDAARSRPDR